MRRRPCILYTFFHTVVHIMLTHRHMLTAAPCSRLTERSHHTSVRSLCSCAPHGAVLNASRNLKVAEPGRRSSVPCLPRSRGFVLVISKHGRVAGSVNGACGEAHRAALTPEQVLMPLVSDTRLRKQPAAFDGDRTKGTDWAFTFKVHASPVSTRMVVLMDHAQSAIGPLDLPTAPSDRQGNAQAVPRACNAREGRSHEEGSKRACGWRQRDLEAG